MKDLAIFHLANRAFIEELVSVGPDQEKLSFLASEFPGETTFDLSLDVDPSTVLVDKDGSRIRRFTGDITLLPADQYTISFGTGADGADQIILGTSPSSSVKVVFSTFAQSALHGFEVNGTGFRFVSDVSISGKDVKSFETISDKRLSFKVLKEDIPLVLLETIKALVPVENTPSSSEVIFDISTRSNTARGRKLMVQRFLTILLSPAGANLDRLLPRGSSRTPILRTILSTRLSVAVAVTRAKYRKTTPENALPAEILDQANLIDLRFGPDGATEATIRLIARSGDSSTLPLQI